MQLLLFSSFQRTSFHSFHIRLQLKYKNCIFLCFIKNISISRLIYSVMGVQQESFFIQPAPRNLLVLICCFLPVLFCRSDRVPGHDGRRLRLGRPGWPYRPTTDSPNLALHQQRVRLLLVLRPGLQLLPLLPAGLWCGVRRQMSHRA